MDTTTIVTVAEVGDLVKVKHTAGFWVVERVEITDGTNPTYLTVRPNGQGRTVANPQRRPMTIVERQVERVIERA